MEAKIINNTNLNKKAIMIATFMNNRFLVITYSIIFITFFILNIFHLINHSITTDSQMSMMIILLILCLVAGPLYPIIASLFWQYRYHKLYNINNQEIEYQIYDLHMKIINKSIKQDTKFEYRKAQKLYQTKDYLIIVFNRRSFIIIDKKGFKKDNDLNKFKAYLKRNGL